MANRNWMNGSKVFTNLTAPAMVNMQFTVDPTDPNGIIDLMSNGYVEAVYMHSSDGSPASPNPASGIIAIQLKDNYAAMINMQASLDAPVTGSELSVRAADTALTIGVPYEITTLGSASAANWLALGVPAGVTPAVGVVFIAIATGAGTSTTSKVKAIGSASIMAIESMGMSSPESLGPQGSSNQGAWIYLKCLAPSVSSSSSSTSAGTPAGSISQGVIPVTAGTAGNAVTNNAGVLESSGGEDLSVNAQTFTGDALAGHTHTITSTASLALTAPATGSIISISLLMDNSSVTVDGL
jgi:hypothetical protein